MLYILLVLTELVHGEKPITKLFVEWKVYRYVDILWMWNSGWTQRLAVYRGDILEPSLRKTEQQNTMMARDNLSFSGKHGMMEFNIDEKGLSIQEYLWMCLSVAGTRCPLDSSRACRSELLKLPRGRAVGLPRTVQELVALFKAQKKTEFGVLIRNTH